MPAPLTNPPQASVVITTCVDSEGLRENLAQVGPQARELGAATILIFNTAEEDIDLAVRQELAGLVDTLMFEPRTGKSHALNTAIAAATGEVIAFTDDDAIPATGWLRELLRPFSEDPTVVGVGGPVLPVFPGEGPPRWYRRILSRQPSSFLGPKHFLGNQPGEYVLPLEDNIDRVPLGANCAWKRDALLRHPFPASLGPNRETNMRGGEDTCVAIQIMEDGGRVIYAPYARVCHPVEPSRMTVEYVMNGYRIQGKEYIRIMKELGRPLPKLKKLEDYLKHLQPGILQRRFMDSDRALRRKAKRMFIGQLIDELREEHGMPPSTKYREEVSV